MAIAVASVSTNTMGTGGVLTKPTGLAVGDLMVAIVVAETVADLASPGGWTNQGSRDTANYAKTKLFTKVADSGDVAASNFTFTGTDIRGGILYRITGGITSTFYFGSGNAVPTGSKAQVIVWSGSGDNGGRTVTHSAYSVTGGATPTFTERLDSSEATSLTTCFGVADGYYNSDTTISAFSVTLSGAIDENISGLFIIVEQQNATAQISHVNVEPTIHAPTGSNTSTAQISHVNAPPTLNGLITKNSNDTTQWINETANPTTWINETL